MMREEPYESPAGNEPYESIVIREPYEREPYESL